ncbi:translocation/assembly module TamB domain-containing protein [candidate division KSB1 bacterium]|nr:translocation/assembly module TamB domain-containing protein [candidate division KSB1 bacterium]
MKRIVKISISALTVLILTIFVAAIILQSNWFKQWLKKLVLDRARQAVAGELQVGRVSGGLASGLSCHDILLTMEGDTVLSVARLELSIQPLQLLSKTIEINRLVIDSPRVCLRQTPDGEWNVNRLFKTPTTVDTAKSDWRLQLKSLRLTHGGVAMQGMPSPLHVEDANLELSVRYLSGIAMGRLSECRFRLKEYDFAVENFNGFFMARRDSLYLQNMVLTTTRSALNLNMQLPLGKPAGFRLKMFAELLDMNDVRAFLPQWPSSRTLQMELTAALAQDSLQWRLNASQLQQSLTLSGNGRLPIANAPLQLTIGFNRFAVSDWIDKADTVPLRLNGRLQMTGKGFDPQTAQWLASVALENSRFRHIEVAHADARVSLRADTVQSEINADGAWGQIQTRAIIAALSQIPQYELTVDGHHLNLAGFLPDDSLHSDLSFQLTAAGNGLQPEEAQIHFSLNTAPSSFLGIPVDDARAAGLWQDGYMRLDSLRIDAPSGYLYVHGDRQTSGWLDFIYHGHLRDTTYIQQWLQNPAVNIDGSFYGRLNGMPDSLQTTGGLALQNTVYEDIHIDQLRGRWQVSGLSSDPYGQVNMNIHGINLNPSTGIDSVDLDLRVFKHFLFLEGQAAFTDSVWTRLRAELRRQDSTVTCLLTDAQVGYKNQLWIGGSDSSSILLSPTQLQLQHISLAFQDQLIALHGGIRRAGEQDLDLVCKNIQLDAYGSLFPAAYRLSGRVHWLSHLQGTFEAPEVISRGVWRQGRLGGFGFDSLTANVVFRDENLQALLQLMDQERTPLILKGDLPLRLSLNDPSPQIHKNKSLGVALQLEEMPLSFLSAFMPDVIIDSRGSGQVQLENTLNHPRPSGFLTIQGDRIDSPLLGQPFRQIAMRMEVDSSAIRLRNLSFKGGDGTLRGEGFVTYDLKDLEHPFQHFSLTLHPDHFTPVDMREVEITLGGDITIEKKDQAPTFSGQLTIERSRFDLTALIQTPTDILLPDRPLLVVSQQDTISQAYDVSVLLPSWVKYFKNVRGSIKIEVPRNTWLRSREMNIEIEGTLDLVKQGPPVELFGSIRILRGTYDLYSRKFDIQTGTLTFLGGETFNLNIDLEAEYVFRSIDRSKKTLKLTVSGQLFNPALKFSLDGLEITETDALSYLLFGRSFDLLTQGEKSDLEQGQEQTDMSSEAMKQLLSWQITGQLSNSLRQQLKLDVIEFRGDQNWRQATVVVGKYITNDLFLSYEREFDFSRSDEAVPERVTLEYEILRSLHLQATRGDERTTGFDVIWKYEK